MATRQKIIVLAIGSDGDVHPMIAIATHLASLGHDVEFLSNEYFRPKVEPTGLTFVPVGDVAMFKRALETKEVWDAMRGWTGVWKVLDESLPLTYEILKQRVTPGAIMVGTSLALAARVLQELTGTKLVTVHLSPSIVISEYAPPIGPFGDFPHAPMFLKKIYVGVLDQYLLDGTCRDDFNRFRNKFGLPPVRHVMTKYVHSPDRVVMTWPEWFAPPQPDWPPNSVCVGFPRYEHPRTMQLTEATKSFIQAGAPPVVFTAGSAMAQSAEHFRCAVEAVRGQDMRAILVSKFKDQIPDNLPPNVYHATYEPFDQLFPLAAAAQHHGGIGTSIQCLTAGKPQLVVPFAHDQFDNALRLQKLQVAQTSRANQPVEWRRKLQYLTSHAGVAQACAATRELILADHDFQARVARAILD